MKTNDAIGRIRFFGEPIMIALENLTSIEFNDPMAQEVYRGHLSALISGFQAFARGILVINDETLLEEYWQALNKFGTDNDVDALVEITNDIYKRIEL